MAFSDEFNKRIVFKDEQIVKKSENIRSIYESSDLKTFTIPSARGFSGPTTVKSIFFSFATLITSCWLDKLIGIFSAIWAVPPLPGAQNTWETFSSFTNPLSKKIIKKLEEIL